MNVHYSLFIETGAKRERERGGAETWNGIVQCMHV